MIKQKHKHKIILLRKEGRQMYSEKVIDHFMNPRNVGEIENADGIGQVGNPKCGDIMRMYLKIENDVIVDAKFKTFGCGAAVATSSMSTELIVGKTVEEALEITNNVVAEALDGLPSQKMHCSNLAEEAVREAINDYKKRKGIAADENKGEKCSRRCDDVQKEE
jgi:nitrogen fixation protein NifU and related proteins